MAYWKFVQSFSTLINKFVYNESNSESESNNESESLPVRRSTRPRHPTKIFTYHELGKDPTFVNSNNT